MRPPTVTMSGDGPVKWQPEPHRLDPRRTAPSDVYLIGHFGLATVDPAGWTLRIDGLVDRALDLDLDALRARPGRTLTTLLECYGNPLDPDVPTRRAANVTWRGVPVADLLDEAGVADGATSLWATGCDSGTFAGVACTEYRKDVPLEVARGRGIVAHEIDGAPLGAERGYPARLVVPGYFGTNNVKWLRGLTVSDRRPEHLFTTRLYLRTVPGAGEPQPVRDLDVNSLITVPAGGGVAGPDVDVGGWAWSAVPVASVEVAVDGQWAPAEVEPPRGRHVTWQRFRAVRRPGPGNHTVAVRATDRQGRTQPLTGARNASHHVVVTVR